MPVPFDAYAWVLTDPRTEVGASPVADVPCLSELPRLIRLRYATEHARWTGAGDPVVTLVDTPGAYPGVDAEERGQAEAIARCVETCLDLRVPLIQDLITAPQRGSKAQIKGVAGDGATESPRTKPYEFGDTLNLDPASTLLNAVQIGRAHV